MMKLLIYGMIYAGSALMAYNIYLYVRYAALIRGIESFRAERRLLSLPTLLLALFLAGYLFIALFGHPDLVVATVLFGGSIFVFFTILLIRRVTDRFRENQKLEARLMAAEESSRTKSSFLSSVSHEMRTPLNAIIGLNTLALKDESLSPGTRSQLEQQGLSAKHLLSLIDHILDVSHLESGSDMLEEIDFPIRGILEPLNQIIRNQCETKGLDYRYEMTGQVDKCFHGDNLRLQQLLISILENAVKFTEAPGRVSFTVEQTRTDEDRGWLQFTIEDDGIGISQDFLPRIYEAFSREDESAASPYTGSGIGLTIAKNIVDLMQGEISVTSQKGQGTTFIVTIPLIRTVCKEEYGSCCRPETDQTSDDEDIDLAGRRVLIVEDMEINAEIVADLLDLEDIESEHAENGSIAMDMFRDHSPGYYDAILMDLRMPIMDGLEAARSIRSLDREDAGTIPIIALTANAFEEDKIACMEAGMNVHLAKPVDADLLYDTLRKYIK